MSNTKQLTKEEAEAKVYNLTQNLLKVKADLKATQGAYKDQIKDIESEIKATIEDFTANATKAP